MRPKGCLTPGFISPGRREMHYCSHFADENNKAKRDSETCSRSPRCRPASVWGADGALRVGVWAQEPPSLVVLRASCSMRSVSFLHDWSTLVPGVRVCVRAIRIAPNVISVTENSHLFIPRMSPNEAWETRGWPQGPCRWGWGWDGCLGLSREPCHFCCTR